jgi:hypothetical protein
MSGNAHMQVILSSLRYTYSVNATITRAWKMTGWERPERVPWSPCHCYNCRCTPRESPQQRGPLSDRQHLGWCLEMATCDERKTRGGGNETASRDTPISETPWFPQKVSK